MVIYAYKLVYIPYSVPYLSDRGVLESAFWVLTSVVEDTSLLIYIMQLKRLEITSFAKLHILQSFDVDDDAVWFRLSYRLLELEVR